MKKKIYEIYLFIHHGLLYFSCFFNSPKFCAYLIKISLFQPKLFKNKSKSKKIIIVLDRVLGARRDLEIIQKYSNKLPQIKFMRRKLIKLVFFYFLNKEKLFFNYIRFGHTNKFNYYELKNYNRKELENFWTKVIYHLKKNYETNTLSFLSFAYYYSTEYPLYKGCNNNKVVVKLWNKECFNSEADLLHRSKSKQFKLACKYFDKIGVYNNPMKTMFVNMNSKNKKKITVTGYPRISDFIFPKKRIKKRVKNILFLSFNTKQGFPEIKKYEKFNFNLTYEKVIKVLNKISKNKNLNICIKRKNRNPHLYKPKLAINKKIKIIHVGTSEKYINKADIIIGHNSSSTLESLVSGKYVIIPFFEKNRKLRKFMYKFHESIIYNSEKKMENKILNLLNKKISFPITDRYNQKTIEYYFGNFKTINIIKKNCIRFLNS